MDNTREKLIELITEFYGVDPMYYGVETQPLADHLIANGVTFSTEIEELKADNERLRNMWAKAVSDLSKEKSKVQMNVDRCVCCGAIIPEGQMVCPNCLVTVKEG